jgi:hypothetical protein
LTNFHKPTVKIATLVRGGNKIRGENHGNFGLCQDFYPTTNNLNNLFSNNCRRVLEECAPAVEGDLKRKNIFFLTFPELLFSNRGDPQVLIHSKRAPTMGDNKGCNNVVDKGPS